MTTLKNVVENHSLQKVKLYTAHILIKDTVIVKYKIERYRT